LTEIYYIFKRCGFSDREFASFDTIKGQSIIRLYIKDEMDARILAYMVQGKNPRSDSIIAEYERNSQRNQREWLQPKK
jgi:hypothetical protein